MSDRDWKGEKVTDEPDDKVINIWEVYPHPNSPDYDYMWIRDWGDMLDLMQDSLPYLLEDVDEKELLENPYTITFQLRKITVKEWNLFVEESE